MGEIYNERESKKYFSIFDNSLVRFCEQDAPRATLLKQTQKDGKVKEMWGVRLDGILGNIKSIAYKCDTIQHNGKEIKIPKVMVSMYDSEETFTVELPFKTYGVDFIRRALTVVRTKKGDSIYALKVYSIKKNGKEFSNAYSMLYENGEKPGIISFYNETNPEPENIKWKKETNAQGETIWNRNASDKFFLDILKNEITPYFENLDKERSKTTSSQEEHVPSDSSIDDDIF